MSMYQLSIINYQISYEYILKGKGRCFAGVIDIDILSS
jgi:hypothetical protein